MKHASSFYDCVAPAQRPFSQVRTYPPNGGSRPTVHCLPLGFGFCFFSLTQQHSETRSGYTHWYSFERSDLVLVLAVGTVPRTGAARPVLAPLGRAPRHAWGGFQPSGVGVGPRGTVPRHGEAVHPGKAVGLGRGAAKRGGSPSRAGEAVTPGRSPRS